ncbi:MAG: hypothetical protein SF182_15465 [Deltaproteobacteria bacterium]|nr:hypothetical protein [Deltaproteobacteria bacterium]
MYQDRFLSSKRLLAALGAVLLLAGAASAQDPVKCRRAIAKNAVKFEATKIKALQKCEDSLLNGKVTSCPDTKASDKIAAAQAKLEEQVDKNCTGLSLADMNFAGLAKQCTGGYRANGACDVAGDCPGICVTGPKDGDPCFADSFCAPGTCSSPSLCDAVNVCPSVQNDSRVEPFGLLPVSDCYFALSDAASVAACVSCVGEQTVDQLIGDYYGTANPASDDKGVLKCQRAVGKAAAKHFAAVRKSLQKCQDGILKGGAGPCPDAKASDKISKSQVKLTDAIAKACTDAQINSGFVLSQIVGASGRPNAGCTTTSSSAAGIAAAIECLTTATATANDALGVGSSPASNNPSCGNAKLDAGENCDDGNQLQESGVGPADFCPTDCNIAACTPAGSNTATVSFTSPVDLTSLTIVLYYPDAKVQVPGVNSDPPVQNAVLSGSFATTPVDTGYALRVVSIDPSLVGVPAGAAFTVTFDTCQGAPALTAGDLACFVADASDANAAPVFGTSCSVTVP